MDILNQVADSMSYYFNALKQFGYKKQEDVNKLLAFIYIEEMLTGDMRNFIKEDDFRVIEQALSCLYGSTCLIPYPKQPNTDTLFGHLTNGSLIEPRITEDSNIRFTEDNRVRFKASNYDR